MEVQIVVSADVLFPHCLHLAVLKEAVDLLPHDPGLVLAPSPLLTFLNTVPQSSTA